MSNFAFLHFSWKIGIQRKKLEKENPTIKWLVESVDEKWSAVRIQFESSYSYQWNFMSLIFGEFSMNGCPVLTNFPEDIIDRVVR